LEKEIKMSSNEKAYKLFHGTQREKISRRMFFSQGVSWTAGLTLLASPGIITGAFASQQDQSKEEIFKELEEKAGKFLPKYRSCALASFGVLNEQFKMNADDRTLRALMPFTGGLVLRGETCGAVSGSMLAIGYFFESMKQKGKEAPGASIKHGGEFFDGFTKEFGSTRCKEVVKHQYGRTYDFLNPEEQKLFMEASAKDNKCLEVVKKAVSIAGDIILENS
jgi:C_GCAxxG_C_C family probable redox protein